MIITKDDLDYYICACILSSLKTYRVKYFSLLLIIEIIVLVYVINKNLVL